MSVSICCFKKENLHCIWDDSLIDKDVVTADSLQGLYTKLEKYEDEDEVQSSSVGFGPDPNYPFIDSEGIAWRFAYVLEPATDNIGNSAVKNAYKQGHIILRKYAHTDTDRGWEIMTSASYFDLPGYEYKVAKAKAEENVNVSLVSNRMLAKWLAQGMGEILYTHHVHVCGTEFKYSADEANMNVNCTIRVRKWDDVVWHVPTKEYLGIEE